MGGRFATKVRMERINFFLLAKMDTRIIGKEGVYVALLKTRLQAKKRWITIFLTGFVFIAITGTGTFYLFRTIENMKGNEAVARSVDVLLVHKYVCGETEEERRKEVITSSDELLKRYTGWSLVSQKNDKYTFEKKVNDISAYCKKRGYFGINRDGELTLFDGLPEKGQVMQTFFQLNQKKLESSLPVEELDLLRHGIHVNDIAEYNSIISTYSEFSDEEKETMAHPM